MDGDKSVTAIFEKDSDSDGISDKEEDGGPNWGDGNKDGTPDSKQKNVTSFQTYDGQGYVTLASPGGTTIANVQASDNPSPADAPADIDFPYGFFSFAINDVGADGTTTVILHLPAGGIMPTTYYKYGPEPAPGDTTPHWYEFMWDDQTETGAVIDDIDNTITLHFVDGQGGDEDIDDTNNTIVDIGGPGIRTSTQSKTGDGGGGGGGGCFVTTTGLSSPVVPYAIVIALLLGHGFVALSEVRKKAGKS
jgi:hypothetical protein